MANFTKSEVDDAGGLGAGSSNNSLFIGISGSEGFLGCLGAGFCYIKLSDATLTERLIGMHPQEHRYPESSFLF